MIALAVLSLQYAGAFDLLHLYAMDLAFACRQSPPPPRDIVVVGIDNASLKEFGPLPWSRSRYAEVVRVLRRAGVKAIGFDMWFTDPARTPAEDKEFAEALDLAGNVYMGMHVAEQGANIKVTRTTDFLRKEVAGEGHVNVYPDVDGKLRRGVWEVHTMAERFTFLPVLLAARKTGVRPEEIRAEHGALRVGPLDGIALQPSPNGHDAFLLDLPETDLSSDYISFRDVAKERFNREQVAGKAVIIGQVILGGGYSDVWNTARGRRFGVVILAGVAQQILDGRSLREVSPAITIALALLLAFAGPWLFRSGFGSAGWLAHAGLLGAIWGVSFFTASRFGLFMQPIPLSAAVILSGLCGTAIKLFEARHELIRDQRAMDILQSLGSAVISASGMPALVTGRKPDVRDSFILPAQTPQVVMKTICHAMGAREGRLFLFCGKETHCIAVNGADLKPVSPELTAEVNRRLREEKAGFATDAAASEFDLPKDRCPDSLLAMPLSLEGRVFGAIQLYGKNATDASPGRAFSPSDLRLAAVMVQQATIGLENASLYENMRGIFLHVTLALANAVDAKDPYTRGHSERVILYSDRLARALGLDMRDIQTIRLAAALHDIGKIAVPDEILRKPGRLTADEYAVIKTHSERGAAIVGPLEELRSVLPGIRNHHERFDGTGYPDGLAGEEIPRDARIICVADSFDAITSKRYYHEERALDAGLEELEHCAGTQFDPDMVRVFVDCMRTVKHPLPLISENAT